MKTLLLAVFALLGANAVLALPYSTRLQELDPNDTLIKVAEKLNLKTFVQKALSTDVSKVINHDGPFTVFAPNDTAFEVEMQYPTGYVLNEAMLFHVGHGKIMDSDMTNEKVVKSLLNGRFIRFNVYNNGQVKTANGRRIMKTDNVARNGVVHVVAGVMSSIYKPSESIVTEMVNHYPQHSTFMELVKMSKMAPVLSNMDTPMTLFAPTNEAMSAVDPDFMNELKNDMNKLRAAVMGHMVKGTFFTPGLISGQTVKTEMGVDRMIETDSQGVVSVGGCSVSLPDIVAANGAVHSVSKFMVTKDEAQSMVNTQSLIERMNTLVEEGKMWAANHPQGGQYWSSGSNGQGQYWNSGSNGQGGQYWSSGSSGQGQYSNSGSNGQGQYWNSGSNGQGQYSSSGNNGQGQYSSSGNNGQGQYSNSGSNGQGQYSSSGNSGQGGQYWSTSGQNGRRSFTASSDEGRMNANYIPQDVWSSSSPNGQWSQENSRTFTASPSSSDLERSSWYQGSGNSGMEEMKEGWGKLSTGASDVVSSLKNLGHREFALAMESSGIASMFDKKPLDGYYTLFAPSDEGWQQTVQTSGGESLSTLVSSHIVSGIRTPGQEGNMESLTGNYIHIDNLNSGSIQTFSPRTSLTANGIPMDGRVTTIKSGHVRILSMTGGFSYIATSTENSILKRITEQPEFSKMKEYAVNFGWDALFSSKDSVLTLLAPSNEAITEAESKYVKKDVASIILSNHIVPGSFFKSKMEADGVLRTLAGHKIAVHSSGSVLELSGGSHIVKMDMTASNGVVHQVDKLILVDLEQ